MHFLGCLLLGLGLGLYQYAYLYLCPTQLEQSTYHFGGGQCVDLVMDIRKVWSVGGITLPALAHYLITVRRGQWERGQTCQ